MKEDTLYQFVGFETAVNLDIFTEQWENYARKFFKGGIHSITLQQQVKSKNRFRYMSMNEWPQDNFCFSFMEKRESDYFPDHRIKVVQVGGYMPVHLECEDHAKTEVKLMLMLNVESIGKKEFHEMPYHFLNIYQAYYQSCRYSYILEFFADDGDSSELYEQLKKKFVGCDVGMYRECLVLEG